MTVPIGSRWTTTRVAYQLDRLRAWLAERHEPSTVPQIAEAIGVTERTARRLLLRLEAAGIADRCGGGLWA